MAHIRQIDPSEATGAVKTVFDASRSRAGGVANIVRLMGLDARSLQASMQLYVSLLKTPNALDPARREMLAAVVSNVNECYY